MLLIIILKIFNSCSLSSFLLSFSNLACSIWNWCSFSNLISSSFLYLEDVNQGMQLVCLKAIFKLTGILFKKCLQYIVWSTQLILAPLVFRQPIFLSWHLFIVEGDTIVQPSINK